MGWTNIDPYPFHVTQWPKSVASYGDYDGGERLQLSWDLGRVSEKEKKQAIKQWVERLPELHNVRWLSLWSHVTPPLLEAACRMTHLECLQIKWSNVRDISSIGNLRHLRYLYFGSSTKIESVEPLAALSNLRLLEIENFKRVTDFSPLARLTSLESLAVTGSMWTRQDIGALETFGQMTWLQSLAIDTSKVKTLRPLANLSGLKFLGVGNRLPMPEYAWLSAMLPNTQCRWFEPYLDLAGTGFSICTQCRQDSKVMLTGKGGKLLCRICDSKQIERHEEAFIVAKSQALAEHPRRS
ncbi:leucine-rich repeat domain-containing protein [Dyella choica]|uniref:Leucine-rich repeat domain-containing protein n=1 Tax=Dyella choica TaxID=1927959 RepID=A0A3S0SC48_9GAMM|nr:leucine-rich repeat domain-containing protein [Dyella choica]RUL78873.1 leucine-rich repeat domain-containing protein [Dyella choica]